MEITSATFVMSNTETKGCPRPVWPEYAFIGRSNVGKSSLINMLCARKKLAKTSGRPGKTQLINHFLINENWYLVDLPGYGYAKVSKVQREKWQAFVRDYLLSRPNMLCLFVLIDSRIPPQKIDLEFMRFLGKKGVPFVIVFTKTDGLTKHLLNKGVAAYKKEMLKEWADLPPIFTTSAVSGEGRSEILDYIGELNTSFDPSLIPSEER